MFKKPFRVKSNTNLKASDRKKFRGRLKIQFPILTENDLDVLVPSKIPVSLVKIQLSSDLVVPVYCSLNTPLVFEIETIFYPTVFFLWICPDVIPAFTAHEGVEKFIMEGADLMLPGVALCCGNICQPPTIYSYGKLGRGDMVYVNTVDNMASVGVGKTAFCSNDMYMSAGRGKCVIILHYLGDYLYSLNRDVHRPILAPPLKIPEKEVQVVDNELVKDAEDLVECAGALSLEISDQSGPDDISADISIPDLEAKEYSSPATLNPDELLYNLFYKSLLKNTSHFQLPILINVFYKNHILGAADPGVSLDIKKTSFKKLTNFLQEMCKTGIIKMEQGPKNVFSITYIDYKHIALKQFLLNHPEITFKTSEKTSLLVPQVTEKYLVNAAVLPLFSTFFVRKGEQLTGPQIRTYVVNYVKNERLQDPGGEGVVVNPVLSEILRVKTKTVPWDVLMKGVFDAMGNSFEIGIGTKKVYQSKGKLSPITLQVATRSGSKKVTLINNLSLYGIDINNFARDCQRAIAASTTVNKMVPGMKCDQLQIQGDQTVLIKRMLTDQYNISKKYIQ